MRQTAGQAFRARLAANDGMRMTAGQEHRAQQDQGSSDLVKLCPECTGPLIRKLGRIVCAHCSWGKSE